MEKTILIVDDEKSITDRFSQYMATGPYNVLTSNCTAQALRIAQSEHLDAATLDYDIDAMNGDVLGERIHALQPHVRMAGITGGDPDKFPIPPFALRASKSDMGQQAYRGIVQRLMDPAGQTRGGIGAAAEVDEGMIALSILLQGYNLGRALQAGEDPVPGVKLRTPSDAELSTLLDVSQIGINERTLGSILTDIEQAAGSAPELQALFTHIIAGNYAVPRAIAQAAERSIGEYLKRFA